MVILGRLFLADYDSSACFFFLLCLFHETR
jgi:hypothetical protein